MTESHVSYGIRAGDHVFWQGPGGDVGTVESVRYSAGIARVIWGRDCAEWNDIDDLFVIMEGKV